MNTASMLGRSALSIVLALFTTRIVLAQLGAVDFGIFGAVGATAAFSMILSNALTAAAMRHMSYDLGRGDLRSLREHFNSALLVYAALAALIVLLGWVLADPVVRLLSVPEEREGVARLAVVLSAGSLAMLSLEAPFQSIVLVHQKHHLYAATGVLNAAARLAAAACIGLIPADRLVVWTGLLVGVQALSAAALAAAAMARLPDARPDPRLFRVRKIADLFAFGSWSVLGDAAWRFRMKGGQILLNVLFGPAVNASYEVGSRVAGYQRSLVGPIRKSVLPVVVSSHGAGRSESTRDLALVTGKYLFIASALVLVPVALETGAVLNLWLGAEQVNQLEAAEGLIALLAVWLLYANLGQGFVYVNRAEGRLAGFTLWSTLIDASSLVVAWALVTFVWSDPLAVPAATCIAIAAQLIFQVTHAGRIVGVGLGQWARRTVLPSHIAVGLGFSAALAAQALTPVGLARLLAVFAAMSGVTLAAAWLFALQPWERRHYARMLSTARNRLARRGRPAGSSTP